MRVPPLLLARLATGAAILLALWPKINAVLLRGVPAEYDATVALTCLTAIAVIWYTYFTWQTLEQGRKSAKDDRDRRRQSIATAVLAELYHVSGRLESVHSQGPTTMTSEVISHPMLERALADPSLFAPVSVQAMTSALRYIRDVQYVLSAYPAAVQTAHAAKMSITSGVDPQSAEDWRVRLYMEGKTRAFWAYESVVRLVDRLKAEGGLMPVGLGKNARDLFDTPALPPDPFDRTITATPVMLKLEIPDAQIAVSPPPDPEPEGPSAAAPQVG